MEKGGIVKRGVLSQLKDRPNMSYLNAQIKKYSVPPSELDMEKFMKSISPLSGEKNAYIKKFLELEIKEAVASGNKGREQALNIWKTNIKKKTLEAQIDHEFAINFYWWLQGRGRPIDHQKTPWGTKPIRDEQVLDYISIFLEAKIDFQQKLFKLSKAHELGQLQGINDYYLFYKYIVCGHADLNEAEFLKDYALCWTPTKILSGPEAGNFLSKDGPILGGNPRLRNLNAKERAKLMYVNDFQNLDLDNQIETQDKLNDVYQRKFWEKHRDKEKTGGVSIRSSGTTPPSTTGTIPPSNVAPTKQMTQAMVDKEKELEKKEKEIEAKKQQLKTEKEKADESYKKGAKLLSESEQKVIEKEKLLSTKESVITKKESSLALEVTNLKKAQAEQVKEREELNKKEIIIKNQETENQRKITELKAKEADLEKMKDAIIKKEGLTQSQSIEKEKKMKEIEEKEKKIKEEEDKLKASSVRIKKEEEELNKQKEQIVQHQTILEAEKEGFESEKTVFQQLRIKFENEMKDFKIKKEVAEEVLEKSRKELAQKLAKLDDDIRQFQLQKQQPPSPFQPVIDVESMVVIQEKEIELVKTKIEKQTDDIKKINDEIQDKQTNFIIDLTQEMDVQEKEIVDLSQMVNDASKELELNFNKKFTPEEEKGMQKHKQTLEMKEQWKKSLEKERRAAILPRQMDLLYQKEKGYHELTDLSRLSSQQQPLHTTPMNTAKERRLSETRRSQRDAQVSKIRENIVANMFGVAAEKIQTGEPVIIDFGKGVNADAPVEQPQKEDIEKAKMVELGRSAIAESMKEKLLNAKTLTEQDLIVREIKAKGIMKSDDLIRLTQEASLRLVQATKQTKQNKYKEALSKVDSLVELGNISSEIDKQSLMNKEMQEYISLQEERIIQQTLGKAKNLSTKTKEKMEEYKKPVEEMTDDEINERLSELTKMKEKKKESLKNKLEVEKMMEDLEEDLEEQNLIQKAKIANTIFKQYPSTFMSLGNFQRDVKKLADTIWNLLNPQKSPYYESQQSIDQAVKYYQLQREKQENSIERKYRGIFPSERNKPKPDLGFIVEKTKS